MGRRPIIKNYILELLGLCGCLSKQMIDQLPFSYNNCMIAISNLLEQGAIRKHGKGGGKHYTLLAAGRQMLLELDSVRYSPDKLPDQSVINRHPERAKASADVQAFLALSGFSSHPDDKPGLPASCAGSLDADPPFNCFYTSPEIKRFFADKNDNGLRYSRATGVLPTPDHLFRVFNSRDVSLEYNKTGERKLQVLTPQLFPGCNKQGNAILVFGNSVFESARKIVHMSWPENKKLWRYRQKREQKGELLDVSNLGTPLHFVPLDARMIPILQTAKYPGGWDFMNWYAMEWLGEAWAEGYGMFYAVVDGLPHFLAHTLNLTDFRTLITHVERTKRPVAVVCTTWQEHALMDMVAENITSDEAFDCIRWRTIEDEFFVEVAKYLEAFYAAENRADFPSITEFSANHRFKIRIG